MAESERLGKSEERIEAEKLIQLTLNANGLEDLAAVKALERQMNWDRMLGQVDMESRFKEVFDNKLNDFKFNQNL